ncbi:MAG: InlB B-repeat-containing protein, partial [Clostridia bacterium]|nr:InlB B-repeat-containing protein [Clostridia bacterium]
MFNKIKQIISVILVLTVLIGVSPVSAFAASADDGEPKLYPEEFYWDKAGEDADNGYKAYSVAFGEPLIIPDSPTREGFNFLGWKDWYTDQIVELKNETMNSTSGRRFYAAWEKTLFTVRFYIGNELVDERTVKENALISAPDVTPPEGYTIKSWYGVPESALTIVYNIPFRMPPCDVNCHAVCEANKYNSYFYVDGELFTTVTNIYNQPFIVPRSPEKDGYTFRGWNPKLPDTTPVGEQRFDAVFEANEYIATLLVDGEVFAEIPYTYGQKSITLPDVPKKDGYTGAWESYTLGIGGVTINAVYSPIEYIATLLVDGEVYKEIPYFYGQKSIPLPEVPKKDGYTGTWESYTLGIGGVTINAIYTPNTYYAYYYVDGKLFTTTTNIYAQPFIVPRSPEKTGYTFSGWDPKLPEITPVGDQTFNATFKPNEYKAVLIVDGEVYREITYTFDQKTIDLPEVPKKTGYAG